MVILGKTAIKATTFKRGVSTFAFQSVLKKVSLNFHHQQDLFFWLLSLVLIGSSALPVFSLSLTAAVVAGSDMMPGQIPDPSLAAGSLPSLGPLAGISATTLTDQLKLADFRQLGTMLSPLHFLGRLGKRPLAIKTEVRRKRMEEKRGNGARVGVCEHTYLVRGQREGGGLQFEDVSKT